MGGGSVSKREEERQDIIIMRGEEGREALLTSVVHWRREEKRSVIFRLPPGENAPKRIHEENCSKEIQEEDEDGSDRSVSLLLTCYHQEDNGGASNFPFTEAAVPGAWVFLFFSFFGFFLTGT